MNISGAIGGELDTLLAAVILGVILSALYDLFRIWRRVIPHGALWVGIEDACYWLLCTSGIFAMLYQVNEGMIRGFAVGGILAGMLIYYTSVSKWLVFFFSAILRKTLHVLQRIFLWITSPIVRILKKINVFLKKQLKKIWKAIKIGVYKL